MASENKSSLNNMLTSLLAVSNQDFNQFLPPSIYSAMYNTVSSWLLSKVAELFPTNQRIIDIARPFMVKVSIPVTNGMIVIPNDCRNFLSAGVTVKNDFSGECGTYETKEEKEGKPFQTQQQKLQEFKISVAKAGCQSRPIVIVDQNEWDYRTTDNFDYPTYKDPIGCFFDSNLKVCPYDLTSVEIRYLRNENTYSLGYIQQPDDTFVYNPETTIETEWETNAYEYIFKGLSVLYGCYSKDNTFRAFAQELKQIGLT